MKKEVESRVLLREFLLHVPILPVLATASAVSMMTTRTISSTRKKPADALGLCWC